MPKFIVKDTITITRAWEVEAVNEEAAMTWTQPGVVRPAEVEDYDIKRVVRPKTVVEVEE